MQTISIGKEAQLAAANSMKRNDASSTTSNPLRGIVSMTLGCGVATISDAATKLLTESHPIGEVLFFRAVFMLVPVAIMVWHGGGISTLRASSFPHQALRAFLAAVSTFLIVASLSLLPLAEVISLLFVAPLFVAAIAMPLLGEKIGRRRWLGVFAGFAGVLVIMRPGADAFQLTALLPIAAAFVVALRDIVTRRISRSEYTTAILFWSTLGLVLAGLATSPFGWRQMDLADIAIAALAGLLFGGAHYLIIEGFRYAEASVVSPYLYSSLVWASILGFILWGEMPSIWLLFGAPLIVGSGIYMAVHERRQSRCSLPKRSRTQT